MLHNSISFLNEAEADLIWINDFVVEYTVQMESDVIC